MYTVAPPDAESLMQNIIGQCGQSVLYWASLIDHLHVGLAIMMHLMYDHTDSDDSHYTVNRDANSSRFFLIFQCFYCVIRVGKKHFSCFKKLNSTSIK